MAIPFVRDMEAAYGRSVQVAPGLRRVLAANPGPFTFLGTGAYIVGRGETAVIDPGPDDPAHLAALLRALEGERVAAILVTHTHADHSPLAAPLAQATGATVWGAPDPGAAGEERRDAAFRPDRIARDGDVVAGPGWTLEVLASPGHASNHLAFAWREANALFPGDLVMGWSTSVVSPPDGDMDAYLDSLERVAARGFATLYPTHGPPITAPAPFLAALREHRLEREAQVLAALSGVADASAEEMVGPVYGDALDSRLRGAAARSLLAHLIRLARSGAVAADAAEASATTATRFRLRG